MKLTQEEKRVKIAEACGWTRIQTYDRDWYGYRPEGWQQETQEHHTWVGGYALPDFLHDLNAMHAVIMNLSRSQREAFETALVAMFCEWDLAESEPTTRDMMQAINATAAQRFEALGQTLNLWEAGE